MILNVGVTGGGHDTGILHVMSDSGLSMLVEQGANEVDPPGDCAVEAVIEIPLVDINDVMSMYFDPYPNVVSVDTEGLDLAILRAIDFLRFRPQMFCVETLTFARDNSGRKLKDVIDFMRDNGYMVYADTFINTIFVEAEAWSSRRPSGQA